MAIIVKPKFHKLEEFDSVNEFTNDTLPALDIKDGKYKAKFTSFKKSNFLSDVRFTNTDLSIGLVFDDCNFKGPLTFTNVKASGFDSALNQDSQNIVFKQCTFDSQVVFTGKNTSIERSLYFEDCTFNQGLNIDFLKVTVEGFTLKNCIINERLDLFDINVKQQVSLSGNTIKCFTRIENMNCDMLSLVENDFLGEFYIRHSIFENGVVLNDGLFKREIQFTDILTKKSGLVIVGAVFEKAFFIKYHSGEVKPERGFSSFYFIGSQFNDGIYVDGTEDLFADYPIVDSIGIEISADLKGTIVFRNLNVGILGMSGYNTAANILFEHLAVNQIKIKSLINNSGLVFSGVKASHTEWKYPNKPELPRENALYIDDSNFGKAQFYQVDFSSFKSIIFHNNILTDISTSLVKWFVPSQLDDGMDTSDLLRYKKAKKSKDKLQIRNARASLISKYRSRQEIYRQLKFASQKQGDIPQALDFQRHEMNYYRKVVAIRRPRKWSELIILWTNQTNDFGQRWIKALGLLILFSFLSYIPIGFLTSDKLDYSKFATSLPDILLNLRVIFIDNLKNWIVVLNPAHRMKDINENIDGYSNWVYLWDLLSRVIVSYFIFQTISAFRKFSK